MPPWIQLKSEEFNSDSLLETLNLPSPILGANLLLGARFRG